MLTLALAALLQDHWPQWRGPLGTGYAATATPPAEWSDTKNVKWKTPIPGAGSATPVVWGERVFVLTAVDTGKAGKAAAPAPERRGGRGGAPPSTIHQFDILCLDLASGKTLWRKTAAEEVPHEGRHESNGFASGSPATDGKILIASFGSRGIFGYDLDGNQKWKRDLGDMRVKVGFGEGISPVLHKDAVIVNWDHEGDSFVVCLDAATGQDRWRRPRDEGTTWTTPLVVEHAGVTQVVVNGTKRTRSYDLATGASIWECGGQAMNPIALPVAKDGVVYCMTGYKGFAVRAIRLDSKGDVTDDPKQVVWKRDDAGPYVASPLLHDGLLYYGKERQGLLMCVDAATGAVRYGPERLPGIETLYASIGGAAGKVYVTGRDGTTLVLKQGPVFEILATNRLGEGVDASPVFLGRRLLLRGEKHLFCLEAAP